MKSVTVKDIRYSRHDQCTNIVFLADYGTHFRRGTVRYDISQGIFLTHKRDVELLFQIMEALPTCKAITV